MKRNEVGSIAGAIWHLLNEKGKLSVRQLGDFTHLKESMIYLALGWLFKENEIFVEEDNGLVLAGLNVVKPEVYY